MSQINLHVTEEFERALLTYMRLRKIRTKSAAIRAAVQEACERATAQQNAVSHRAWLGLGAQAPQNESPRFRSDDDLWSDG